MINCSLLLVRVIPPEKVQPAIGAIQRLGFQIVNESSPTSQHMKHHQPSGPKVSNCSCISILHSALSFCISSQGRSFVASVVRVLYPLRHLDVSSILLNNLSEIL